MNRILSFAIRQQWSGILAGVIVGGIALSFATPQFLSEFNWFVMLRSICVSLLVAFSQMVMLGVGQMNLSVGALGGLVAIIVGGLMDAWGMPPLPASIPALPAPSRSITCRRSSWPSAMAGSDRFPICS